MLSKLKEFVFKHYLSFLVLVFTLSVIDGFFTVFLLRTGKVREVNPLMDYILQFGEVHFIVIKFLLTFVGCFFLNYVKEKYNLVTFWGIIFIAAFYVFIVCSHLYISYHIF